jgi:type II secretory pathway component PulK
MNQRGIALLATLWLLAALSVVAASALTLARVERGAAVNRVALARGRWAAEGCLAIVEAELLRDPVLRDVDSTDLGHGLWCRASIEDPGTRLAVRIENAEELARLIGDPARAAALLDWIDPDDAPRAGGAEAEWYAANRLRNPRNGSIASLLELRQVRGFDSVTVDRVAPFLTVRDVQRINVNLAPREVLAALPGMEPGAIELIVEHREQGAPFRDLDGLLATLPASLRAPLIVRYAELQGKLSFTPERVLIHLEGHLPESATVVRTTIEGVPAAERLAIVGREEW